MLSVTDRYAVIFVFTLGAVAGALLLAVYRAVRIERIKQEFVHDLERRLNREQPFESTSCMTRS